MMTYKNCPIISNIYLLLNADIRAMLRKEEGMKEWKNDKSKRRTKWYLNVILYFKCVCVLICERVKAKVYYKSFIGWLSDHFVHAKHRCQRIKYHRFWISAREQRSCPIYPYIFHDLLQKTSNLIYISIL